MISKRFLLLFLTLCFVPRTQLINLGNACKNMWKAAGNNLITLAGPNQELKVEITAANPLFTVELGGGGPAKIASLPFTRFHALLGDYDAHPPAPILTAHINDFLNALAQPGGPVEAAYNYLRGGGFLPVRLGVNNLQDFRALLKDMWFTGSTGFEHVFVGEQYTSNGKQFYKGFHNWYQFMVEQGRLQTTGIKQGISYLPDTKPAFLSKLKFKWRGAVKNPGSSMFAGTSPAFDLAMFSTCFIRGLAAPFDVNNKRVTDCDCHIDAGGKRNKVEIKTVEKSTNADKVLTAYPTKVQSFEICLGNALLKRLDCGYLGITRQECEGNRDCCWDDTVHGVNWCFRSEPDLADRCRSIDVPKRVDCGWVGITEAQCLAKNCCWDDLKYNSPSKHCFNPSGP